MPLRPTVLKTILVLSILISGWRVSAQKTADYETISTAQGLSQGMVFDLLQDQEGFIWAATKNGLNRYDGYGFKVFSNDPYNAHSLSSNTIVKLFEDSKGRLWAGTEDAGLNVYDKKSGKFHRIVHLASDPGSLSGDAIRSIEELSDGRILVAADGAGLNVLQLSNTFFEKDAAPIITRLTLPGDAQVYGMGKDNIGRIWIGGMDGTVYQYDPLRNSFVKLNGGQFLNNGYLTKDSSILINNNLFLSDGKDIYPLFDIKKTPAGNIIFRPREKLWENHHRELHFYDVSKWDASKMVKWNVHLPERIRIVYPFITDRSGMIWSGSVGYGLRKYLSTGNKFQAQLPGYSVRWIVPVSSNDIYAGDFAYGWRRLRNDSTEKNPFAKISNVTEIDNFIITKNGNYWIKSDNKGYFNYNLSTQKLTSYPGINSYQGVGDKQPMLEDSKGNIWFPGLGGHFIRLNTITGRNDSFSINTNNARPILPKAICTALYEDEQGAYWIGTQDGFANVIFSEKENKISRIKWYYNNSNSRNSLNYNHVSCFLDDPTEPSKYLWICTKGGGLNRLNKKTGDFVHLTTQEGLPHDVVYGILADNARNIWGSTNNGIFCLLADSTNNNSQWVIRNFSKAYGLQDDEFNTGAYAKLPNGDLAFGGVNGLNIFNPKDVLTVKFTPKVFITNILINNLPVAAGDETGILPLNIEATKSITLNYLQDILTLEFSSLDFTAPLQNRYRYQLVGVDKGWVEGGTRRTATYLHLPSGIYTFKVQGSNSQGIWSDEMTNLNIIVQPPWWRTWWAYTIYALLLLICIRAYFKFSVNRARLKAQLNFEQREAKRIKELDTLKTQLYTNITHEFRTPLTVILGMAQQVMDKPDENFTNNMHMIVRNGESLLNLVNEMLDLTKLEAGKMSLQLVNGDIINFLRYVIESFHSLAESNQKGLHFLTNLDSLYVAYDPEKVRKIVANLLSNALKFTPEKGNIYFNVGIHAVPHDETKLSLIIQVKDTGIGIPEHQLLHIFDRFYQLDNSHTRKAGGTGIGLALTRELVKLMEGEISVKSPPSGSNKGSEFTVILPMLKVAALPEPEAYPVINETFKQRRNVENSNNLLTEEKEENNKPLILLVEDNADVIAYTATCLSDYKLLVGNDGREGFEIATKIIPDLIITDVMMPFVDGFELCRRLRNDEHTSHIPIIMLTAKADIESKIQGLQQGADVFLQKPFHKEELLVRIKKLLELRKNLQQYYLKKLGLNNTPDVIILKAAETKIEDAFVKKIREAIEANLGDANFTVEQLCNGVFISHSQLHRKLEAVTGLSPNKFIRTIRMSKAKELLKDPSNSIASIADVCGYNDPGYFSRVFKQDYGVTPQEWRVNNKLEV
jgi:signal transduction histidine kinase/DNA-binding response OmpR family regulator/ligand-binding sensor domain-containing protein